MIEHKFVLLIIGFINLSLGITVYFKNKTRLTNRLFCVFALSMAIWSFGNYLVHSYTETRVGLIYGGIAFAAASFIPFTFLMFSIAFLSKWPSLLNRKEVVIFSLFGLFFSFVSFTPLMLRDVTITPSGIKPQYGPAYPFFAAYFLFCLGYAYFSLGRKLKQLQGIAKAQVQYLFLGTFLAGCGGTITNLIFPLVFHTSRFSAYGPFFSLIMVGTIAHAIVRYRLMDIRLVVKKGMVYVLSSLLIAIGGLGLAYLLKPPLAPFYYQHPFLFAALVIFLVAFSLSPLKNLIQTLIDRYFFRDPYDYQRTIYTISHILNTILDPEVLAEYLTPTVAQTLRAEWSALFLPNEERVGFQLSRMERSMDFPFLVPTSLNPDEPLLKALHTGRDFLIREELEMTSRDGHLKAELDHIGCDIVVPLRTKDRLVGLLLMGPKLSGDPYFNYDLEWLSTIANQAALALKNAELYQEVLWVKEYNESILENMESGVVTIDCTGRITLFNKSAERMTSFSAKEVLGKRAELLGQEISQPLLFSLRRGKPLHQVEGIIRERGENPRPIIFNTSLLHDHRGQKAGAIMVFSDLSQIKRLEEEKNRAEHLASVGALAAGLSHEIKTPLVAIKTFAELLPTRYSDPEFRDGFLQVMVEEIERIDSLITQFSGLAKYSSPKFEFIELHPCIDEALALFSVQMEKKGVKLTRDYAEKLPPVWADRIQLKQVLLNLIRNALEAMPQGGSFKIATRRAGDRVEVYISDTGLGIPEHQLSRVFDPFFTTKEKGMGLGLTICRRIIEEHGGYISLENNLDGLGVTVKFSISMIDKK